MIFRDARIEAAWSSVRVRLSDFKRGDDISFAWLESRTGITDGGSLEERMRRYFKAIGIDIQRRGDRFHLPTHEEQLEREQRRRKHTKREDVRILRFTAAIDRDGLNDKAKREADHLQRHAVARLEGHDKFDKERRAIMSAPEPRPLPPRSHPERPKGSFPDSF